MTHMGKRSHWPAGIAGALSKIPRGRFVLTAAREDARAGVLVEWVQRCSLEPPMVVVANEKGRAIEPLIRDGRGFVLCQIPESDRFLTRLFEEDRDLGDDPFYGTPTRSGRGGAPILEKATAYLECELVRHVDIESEFELYVGLVVGGGVNDQNDPLVLFGTPTRSPRRGPSEPD